MLFRSVWSAGSPPCRHLVVGATNHTTRRRVFELCERAHIKLLVIPDVQELMSGQVKVSQIRYVDVDDLLGRDPVSLDTGGLRQMLEGKSVLVTGGGGSIGFELCRQIARFKPGQIIIYKIIPSFIADFVYDYIAKRRKSLGKYCPIPTR